MAGPVKHGALPLRALAVAGAAIAAGALSTATASIVDDPRFKTLGIIIVWGGDDAGTPIVSDFVMDTSPGNLDADLIAGDVSAVVTGTLVPPGSPVLENQSAPVRIRSIAGGGRVDTDTNGDGVLDSNDSFGSFGIRASTDNRTRRMELNSSFYVASNTAFHIDATATPVGATTNADLARVRGTLRVELSGNDGLPYGSAAQYPHTGGETGGRRMNGRRLSTLLSGFTVFRGNQATAAIPGSISEQSVRFDINYRYNFGNVDLSAGTVDIEAEVVYTLYVP
ncbi:MAG: hypothetical protein AAF253_01005 [Pseudomonadota bacterium]